MADRSWSLASIYYHTSVSAGGDVSRAREITIGQFPVNLSATLNLNLHASLAVRLDVAADAKDERIRFRSAIPVRPYGPVAVCA